MRVKDFDFKKHMQGKNLWAITTTTDDGESQIQPLIEMLMLIAKFMGMNWVGILIEHDIKPGDALHDTLAVENASNFFAHNLHHA